MTSERAQPRWSIGLGSLFGIPIRVHVSFLFLVVWFLAWAGSTGQDVTVWMIILALVLIPAGFRLLMTRRIRTG